jgi:hypothetical protein
MTEAEIGAVREKYLTCGIHCTISK